MLGKFAQVLLITFVSLLLLSAFQFTVPSTVYCQSPPPNGPYVYVLVNSTVYGNLSSALSTYEQDLENNGFSVEIPQDFGDNATAIREFLRNETETHEVAGALLVGDIPYAEYEYGQGGTPFLCDLFYMDLDGNWTDSDSDGAYDMHTNETGDVKPEIWAGRLYASTVEDLFDSTEVQLINNYFDKNHRFRTGELTLPRRSIGYIDDDFLDIWGGAADVVNSSLSMIYRNETTLVTDTETTNAADYKNRLSDTLGYEWLFLAAHSNPRTHAFWNSSGQSNVYSSDIESIDTHVFFYHLIACQVAKYSFTDYIGGTYIFADTYGLLVSGSTASGGMNDIEEFYEPIAEGKCIGQAFKEWCEKISTSSLDYGQTILGDPTLRAPPICYLTVLAEDQFEDVLTRGWVYIDDLRIGTTGSTFTSSMGNHTVWVSDFWESGNTGYRYRFDHWEDNSTDNPRNMTVVEDTTVKAHFYKKWCPGDVDGDGVVTVLDLLKAKLAMSGYIEDQRTDVNGDDEFNILDVKIVKINMGNEYPDP